MNEGKVVFTGKILIVGFGSIGQGLMPLLFKHLQLNPNQVSILTADNNGEDVAKTYNTTFEVLALTKENFKEVLDRRLLASDVLLNLSVDVSSYDLIEYCQKNNTLYLDTCTEPWAGWYTNSSLSLAERSNHFLRKNVLSLRDTYSNKSATALITHGANPGLVSHFVKQALLNIASDIGLKTQEPTSKEEWANLAKKLDIKVIQIAERDTQLSSVSKKDDEFCNTWSVEGLYSEACQPSELGWGTHETVLPREGHFFDENKSAIYINKPGYTSKVTTFTPSLGVCDAKIITHAEALSISDYFTTKDSQGEVTYRPTVYYAYRPSDATMQSLQELETVTKGVLHNKQRIMMSDLTSGYDELGVLLIGHKKNAYWYGSRLDITDARKLAPNNNATSLHFFYDQ